MSASYKIIYKTQQSSIFSSCYKALPFQLPLQQQRNNLALQMPIFTAYGRTVEI